MEVARDGVDDEARIVSDKVYDGAKDASDWGRTHLSFLFCGKRFRRVKFWEEMSKTNEGNVL